MCLLYVKAIIAYKFIYVLTDNKKAGLHQNHSATTPTHKRIVCFYYV